MQRTTKGLTLVLAIVVILLNLLLLVKENYIFSFLRPFGPVRTSSKTLISLKKAKQPSSPTYLQTKVKTHFYFSWKQNELQSQISQS